MQNIFTNIKCSEIILYNANENWYIILYDLFSRLCYIATCGPFCKDATHISADFKISICSADLLEPRSKDISTDGVTVERTDGQTSRVTTYGSFFP